MLDLSAERGNGRGSEDFDPSSVAHWLARFRGLRVGVTGELFLEKILRGRMTGVAPEGPTPLISVEDAQLSLGGAGFAAEILSAFCEKVEFVGVLGEDEAGKDLAQLLQRKGISAAISYSAKVSTPVVSRVMAVSQRNAQHEVLRLQQNPPATGSEEIGLHLLEAVRSRLSEWDALLVVEQGLGMLSAELVEELGRAPSQAHPITLVGDLQTLGMRAKGYDALVLNAEEAGRALSLPEWPENPVQVANLVEQLRSRAGAHALLVTRGPKPAVLARAQLPAVALPVEPVPVYDVTGAGETVAALLTLGLAAGLDGKQAAELALRAGTLSVTLPGRAVVGPQQLLEHEERRSATLQAEKIVSRDRLRQIVAEARRQGQRVVWTNGCFDLLHVGHILYLEKAKQLGDLLIVGINSDASVRATKGPGRPIVHENQRARLLASLSCTDYVLIFDEPSPKEIIAELRPDVYVKGGDYTLDTINQEERRIVEGYGGQIALLPGVEGMSTSELIRRVLAAYGGNRNHTSLP
ncbi:MAG: D-glycero-beta-D-manno-heptose 1-phosphate adenylyltransferase [candidate division KSB1 bacterium]|nr:D-glycero-beta-D-manno-heptose 1-phosphate adenylyltransferase [candidate division KSB1 bacterium]